MLSGDAYYALEESHLMNVSDDGLSDVDSVYELFYCQIENDTITLQLKTEKRSRLIVQGFPPSVDFNMFQPDLKQDGEVVFADDLTVFVYLPYKETLEVLHDGSRIGFIEGKLKNNKVVKDEMNGTYLMVINDRLVDVRINLMPLLAEATPRQLEYTKIHDFCYKDGALYLVGLVNHEATICVSKYMTGAFPQTFSTPLSGRKLKFIAAEPESFLVYDKEQVYSLVKGKGGLEVQKRVLIPLTASGIVKKAMLTEEGAVIVQDDSKRVYVFSDRSEELLLQEKTVLGSLVAHRKDIYVAELDNGIVQFYRLQKVSLANYARQFASFAELKPMKHLWLANPETRDLFYEAYLRDHIDDILDLEEVMGRIKNTQLKIKLMQKLAPSTYQKLVAYLELLKRDAASDVNASNQPALLKVIEENKKQISLFMELNEDRYSKEGYMNYKQMNILALISQYIGRPEFVGLICSAYVKETISNYDKIIERIIEFELEETPKDESCIEKLLPLGKRCNELIASGELGTFTGYWRGMRDQMRTDGFVDYSKDHNNYFKVIRLCLTKFKKSMSTALLRYVCVVVNCGQRRGVENLDFLYFDFNLRADIALLPDEDYDVELTSETCSEVTFASFITRHGKDSEKIVRGIGEYYEQLIKYIKSVPVSTKEFFKLFERYMLHSKISYFGEIIGELNQARGNTKEARKYDFLYDNKPSIYNIALKHIYTQENVLHTLYTSNFVELLKVFLGDMCAQYNDNFKVIKKHIEIAGIFKRYELNQYTFKEICRLSNLPEWKAYVEFISKLIDEEITLADRLLLVSLQKNIIGHYCAHKAKNAGLFNRNSWKECLSDVTRLSVVFG